MPQIQDCKRELRYLLSKPNVTEDFIEVNAGTLHHRVFGDHSADTPVSCAAMRSELHPGDQIVAGTDHDSTATFTIRYVLPRPNPVVQGDAVD